jgi:hypothetical protein
MSVIGANTGLLGGDAQKAPHKGVRKMAKIYTGKLALVSDPYMGAGSGPHERWREHVALVVTVDGQPLDPRLDLANRSPDGFATSGKGAYQLALAILADFFDDGWLAAQLAPYFARDVIAKLPREREWQITSAEIRRWLDDFRLGRL